MNLQRELAVLGTTTTDLGSIISSGVFVNIGIAAGAAAGLGGVGNRSL
jgi:hypothetical protein